MLSTIYMVFYLGVPFSFRYATFEFGLYQGTPFGSRPIYGRMAMRPYMGPTSCGCRLTYPSRKSTKIRKRTHL